MSASVDTTELEKLAHRLESMTKSGLPHAVRNGLNRGAFAARKLWVAEMRSDFTLRNKWTTKSPRVETAKGLIPAQMQAVLGSPLAYLAERERGATKGTTIPTPAAAGQSGKRTKPVKAPMRLSSIRLTSRKKSGSKKQRNAAAITQARAKGNKFVFLEGRRADGIFKMSGGKRRLKLTMIWNLSKRSVVVRPMPTLGQTIKKAQRPLERIYRGAMLQQLKRNGLQ